jgi:hypothetical protein
MRSPKNVLLASKRCTSTLTQDQKAARKAKIRTAAVLTGAIVALIVIILAVCIPVSLTFSSNEAAILNRFKDDISTVTAYNKSLLIGEFGLMPTSTIQAILNKFVQNGAVAGVLLWSLRSHAEGGGFCILR